MAEKTMLKIIRDFESAEAQLKAHAMLAADNPSKARQKLTAGLSRDPNSGLELKQRNLHTAIRARLESVAADAAEQVVRIVRPGGDKANANASLVTEIVKAVQLPDDREMLAAVGSVIDYARLFHDVPGELGAAN